MIRNLAFALLLAVLAASLLSCSKGGSISAPPLPNIAGAWEFQAISSTNTNSFTGIEVALQEGQTIINGVAQPNGQVSAAGAGQIAVLQVDPTNATVAFGGSCPATGGGGYALSGSIQSFAGPFNFSYTENGNTFNVTGTISADGKSFQGTYASGSPNSCPDSGTVTGTAVSKLAGTYAGRMILPDGITYDVTAALSENSKGVLSINLQATSPNAVTLTLTGSVTGNAFVVQGTYQGQQVTYEGYFGVPVTSNGQVFNGIYFANATGTGQASYAGTLIPSTTFN